MELSERQSIKEFDQYLERLLSNIQLDKEEKEELGEEWKQHLYDHYHSLRKKGIDEVTAIQTSIEHFGEIEMLQQEVNNTYPNAITSHVQREVLIGVIILIASIIGPSILIEAHFRAYFIIAPIQALILAYIIYRFVIKKQTYWVLSLVGFAASYIFFIQMLPQIYGSRLTLDFYASHLFSLEWDRLTGSNGLFEFVTIHMLWYVIITIQFFSRDTYTYIWKKICHASFQYWTMLLIAVFFARFQSSAEWGVLFLNVFLLYAFLQQTISIQALLIYKEKVRHLILRQRL
jgi:hypothetical protein